MEWLTTTGGVGCTRNIMCDGQLSAMRKMRDWPIEDLILLAHCRLSADKTTTSYTFDNGFEQRTISNPLLSVVAMLGEMARCVGEITGTMRALTSKWIGNECIPYGASFGSVINWKDKHVRLVAYEPQADAWTFEEVD